MSASEKLRRLTPEIVYPGTGASLVRIHAALPALIAVVEAAESAHLAPDMLRPARESGYAALSSALATLDEALGEK